jgi:SDR family mycofactocin-dependent oxidoreductase
MQRLKGKVALITGGARGQGRAIAAKFASEGADVLVTDICRDLETVDYRLAGSADLDETAALVRSQGRRCIALVADVRDQADMDRAVETAIRDLGQLDIVISNAGIVDYKPFWEITDEEWTDTLNVNLTGAWHVAKAASPHMIERMHGNIVFTASCMGVEANVNFAHYIASKHGVLGLMKSVALELGPYDIRVNAILSGPVDTPMNDNAAGRDVASGRVGATRADHLSSLRRFNVLRGRTAIPSTAVADAMTWLVSDEAQHITGLELSVDAGHRILPGVNLNPVVVPIPADVLTTRPR